MKHKCSLLIVVAVLAGCNRSPSDSTTGNLDIVLTSSSLMSRRNSTHRAGTNCSVTYESTTVNGKCYTPLEISGVFSAARLSSTSGGDPVRLLGGGSVSGLESVFQRAAFDLNESPTIEGEDNIQDGGGSYNLLGFSIQALQVAFEAEAGGKIYRVRIPFTTTPPSASSAFSSCGLDSGALDLADELGSLWSSFAAQPGDILVCIKNLITDTCADADYQWVDSNGDLQATRPGSAKQLSGAYFMTADDCDPGTPHPSVTWGSANLDIGLNSAVTVSAEFGDGGVKTYTVGSETGQTLTATIDVDVEDSLFVPDALFAGGDLSAQIEADILDNIEEILLKSFYVSKHKTTAASTGDGLMTATATLTVD